MAKQKSRIEQANASVIVVSFETGEGIRTLRHRLDLPFIFALDPDRVAYRGFGLERAGFLRTYMDPAVALFYARELLHRRVPGIRRGQDRRQLGGDFVLDREGVVVMAHPERGPKDRASLGSILEAIDAAA